MFTGPEGGPMTINDHLRQIRWVRGSFDLDQDRGYGVFDPETGKQIGEVALLQRTSGFEAAELGTWIRRDAEGKGLAVEMNSAMLRFGFEYAKLKRVDAFSWPENERSAALARRLGFFYEGRLRQRQQAPHHKRTDMLAFSIVDSEFPSTPASKVPILQAFDIFGKPMSWPSAA
jgi:RimJ/RimL family protein N-acetyltransferase